MHDAVHTILIAAADSAKAADDAGTEQMQSLMHGPLMWLASAGIGVLVLGILLTLVRMVKGPHIADRVLAGDTMAMLVAGLVVVIALLYESAIFYDAALVVAVLGFVSTVAFSQYLGAKHKHAEDPEPLTNEEGSS